MTELPPTLLTPPTIPASAGARRRPGRTVVCMMLVVGFVTAADLFIKRGANAAHNAGAADLLHTSGLAALGSGFTMVGICFHLLGLGAWMYTLRTVPLTIAYCFTAAQQATIALGAWWWLGEAITPLKWAGIGAVFAGLLVLVPAIIKAEQDAPAAGEAGA